MSKTSKTFSRYLFSAIGIAAMALLLIAINVISSVVNGRLDMTEEKRYTLSQGTRTILKGMDAPVTVRFYFSSSVDDMPLWMKNYAPRVLDMLKEYELAADGRIRIEAKNPTPDSDDEESATLDGVYGQMLANGDQIYFGMGFSCLDESAVIPVLSPQDESMLEYDITRAISQVLHPEKPVVGVMSSLPVMGAPPNMMMMQRGMGGRGTPAWYVIQDLKRDFDLKELPPDTEAIDDNIDILMVVHPKDLSEETLYALDQFVLRGGKLVAFVDPMSYVEMAQQQPSPMGPPPGGPSTLGKLFDAWGVQFDTNKLVADLQYELEWRDQNGQFQRDPFMLHIDQDAFSADDPTTSQLESGILAYPGAFSGEPVEGLTKTILAQSSIDSALIASAKAQTSITQVIKDIKPGGVKQALAIRLTGTFPTAFPDGLPKEAAEKNGSASDDGKEDTDEKTAESLKSGKSAVVLVADVDMLHDAFCIRRSNFLGQSIVQPSSDNIAFVHNVVDHLGGDANLLSVRSLGVKSRPFTVIQEKRAEAEREYQAQIGKLEGDLEEIADEIRSLQQGKNPDQRFVLTPEQQAKLVEMQRSKTATGKELKKLRKEFRKDIESLQNWLKFANIAAVPLLVALIGVSIALIKRGRMARK